MRLPDIERRLLNWARWRIGCTSGGIGFATVQFGHHRVDGEGFDAQSRIPTSDCEASATDQGIKTLAPELQETLERHYVRPRGARENARLLGVSEATVKARIERAQRTLAGYFSGKAEEAKQERARVEKLQRLGLDERGFGN